MRTYSLCSSAMCSTFNPTLFNGQAMPELMPQPQMASAGSYASPGLHAPTAPSGVRWPSNLRPAFRSSPQNAAQRQLSDKRARILFVDEGNSCRFVPTGVSAAANMLSCRPTLTALSNT
jgi:hypothetical protein